MIPDFVQGNLPAGIHWASWDELVTRFSHNERRLKLLDGLKAALKSLRDAGCVTAYVDGSFVTSKEFPNDFDGCWEVNHVDPIRLDPILLKFGKFDRGRIEQKAKYGGELFPVQVENQGTNLTFLEFFQFDKSGSRKGIVAVDLRRLP